MKQVIHIFGASGSGTTTLGKYISEKLGYYFIDTDDYFWEPTEPPYTTKREIGERVRLMEAAIAGHDNVVISGSLSGWGDPLIPRFTLVIRVVTDTPTRLERLKAREEKRFGRRLRQGGDMYAQHMEFLNWAASYDTGGVHMRSKSMHDLWQARLPCPVLQVDGCAPTERNLRIIKEQFML